MMNTADYVRVVEGSEYVGKKGGPRYNNIEVYDQNGDTWRTIRSCADPAEANKIAGLIAAGIRFAYGEGRAATIEEQRRPAKR